MSVLNGFCQIYFDIHVVKTVNLSMKKGKQKGSDQGTFLLKTCVNVTADSEWNII